MTIGEVRELFAYDAWANARVFEAASALTEEQCGHSIASSFPSVAGTLAHLIGAEWVWLRRWLGESPGGYPDWVAAPTLADLRARLATVESERDTMVADMSEADLGRVVSYRTLSGQASEDPLGGLMRHVVNHSTYHRGQIATLLRQLGLEPPSTDLIIFQRQTRSRAALANT
jgi:uncharacterized damage-inducible protein DinB